MENPMSMYPQSDVARPRLGYATDDRAVFNFFNTVYAWMCAGLALTAVVAWLVSRSPAMMSFLYGSRAMILVFALGAFAIAWFVQSAAARISATAATGLFLLYAAVIGALISYIFLVYESGTILAAFLLTGGTFGAMSVYGFVTKRDLTGIGSFLVMGAIGLFIASLVNVFIASNALSWVITYAVLGVFIGITAYETQRLRNMAEQHAGNADLSGRLAIVGALVLYIAFINIFLSILRILGSRR
jgi:FtsH-binding integral membrane protein